jgi:hypothetical protein
VAALHLNSPELINLRRILRSAGEHPREARHNAWRKRAAVYHGQNREMPNSAQSFNASSYSADRR